MGWIYSTGSIWRSLGDALALPSPPPAGKWTPFLVVWRRWRPIDRRAVDDEGV